MPPMRPLCTLYFLSESPLSILKIVLKEYMRFLQMCRFLCIFVKKIFSSCVFQNFFVPLHRQNGNVRDDINN